MSLLEKCNIKCINHINILFVDLEDTDKFAGETLVYFINSVLLKLAYRVLQIGSHLMNYPNKDNSPTIQTTMQVSSPLL